MNDFFKININVALSIIVPIAIFNAIQVYWSASCDPKFGCLGVAYLLTLIAFVFYIVAATSISFTFYILKYRKSSNVNGGELVRVSIGCIVICIAVVNSIIIAEMIGIISILLVLTAFSFLIGIISFRQVNVGRD